jgi:hypothetical protein
MMVLTCIDMMQNEFDHHNCCLISGIAEEMALFNPEVRRRTDALDAAGNTTAAIGKACDPL